MYSSKTPKPRLALQQIDSNAADFMDVEDLATTGLYKTSQIPSSKPHTENQSFDLNTPDPAVSEFELQQALLHSPQFDGSPNTVFKLKLAHLGFVEGSPPDSKLQQQHKVCQLQAANPIQ